MTPPARTLIIAGSDSSGGAGIQADIKTVTMLGGYAATAITAITAQDTIGVHGVWPVPASFVADQVRLVLQDIGADAVKIGMMYNTDIINAVTDVLEAAPLRVPLVLDPVMVAKGGQRLLDIEAEAALKRRLFIYADLLTPNLPEAEALTGLTIRDAAQMHHAADMLRTMGCRAVLLKGGHLPDDMITDLLITEDETIEFTSPRLPGKHTHGTGCTLASAVATSLGQGLSLAEAVVRAREYVHAAITHAPGFGRGNGPLGHNYALLDGDS
jgi:hydroxymethylpyrimidine/phosphomethylpyrimidine kinase